MKRSLIFIVTVFSSSLWAQRPPGDHVFDRLVVQRRSGASAAATNRALGANGALVVGQIPQIDVLILRVPEQAADRIAAALERSGQFTFIERDYLARSLATPNDPYFSSQGHFSKIQAPSAWDITVGSSGIPVGVIDSGVETTHPDLASKLVAGWNFITGTSTIVDNTGHGTATSGTIAAASNNGSGVTGVAWANPIMPLVVVDSAGSASYSNMANAITYAADHGVRVINMSLAGSSGSSTLQTAVTYAWNKGAIVVAAAGNYSTSTPYYPAACQYAVAVSATDASDAFASFSNYGSWIDLAAPGDSVFTTSAGGSYGYHSGTSFSAPIVAGVAALVLSAKPSLSAQTVVSLLQQNADDLGAPGYDIYYGYGRVNAYKAVAAAQGSGTGDTAPPTVSLSSPVNGVTVAGSVQVQGIATDNLGAVAIQFYVDNKLIDSTTSSPFSFLWNSASVLNGTHTLSVTASDAAGNIGSASVSVNVSNVTVTDTIPPVVTIQSPISGASVSKVGSGNIQISASATDNVAVGQVSFYVDDVLKCTDTSSPYTCTWNTKKAASGAHAIKVTAWDAAGNFSSASTTVYK